MGYARAGEKLLVFGSLREVIFSFWWRTRLGSFSCGDVGGVGLGMAWEWAYGVYGY